MAIQRLDHVGIVVDDLAATQSFFRDIGLQVGSEFRLEGEWLDNVVGLPDVHTESVTMQTPDGAREARAHEVHTPADHEGCSAVRRTGWGSGTSPSPSTTSTTSSSDCSVGLRHGSPDVFVGHFR